LQDKNMAKSNKSADPKPATKSKTPESPKPSATGAGKPPKAGKKSSRKD